MAYDPDLPGEDLDYDLADFETRDALDDLAASAYRTIATGYPARPVKGVRL